MHIEVWEKGKRILEIQVERATVIRVRRILYDEYIMEIVQKHLRNVTMLTDKAKILYYRCGMPETSKVIYLENLITEEEIYL